MKTKTYIIFALAALIFTACTKKEEPTNEVIISGKIENMKGDLFLIQPSDRPYGDWDTTFVDHEGNFVVKLDVDSPQYFQIWHGEEVATLFLDGGYDLQLSMNTDSFDESLKFTGKGSEVNNYLMEDVLFREKYLDFQSLLDMDEKDFFAHISKMEKELKELYDKRAASFSYVPHPLTEQIQEKHFYDFGMYRIAYIAEKSRRNGALIDLTDEDIKFMENFDISDSNFMKSRYFYSYLRNYQDYLSMLELKIDTTLDNSTMSLLIATKRAYEKIYEDAETVEKKIVNKVQDMIPEIIAGEENNVEDLLDFMSDFENQEYAEEIRMAVEHWQNISPGNPAPDFSYPDINGETVSLSDFKGKYVYIDVWATWCGPCRDEIPHLKTLHEKYKDRNIVFMSVSVDQDESKGEWENMVKEKEMKGVQLFAGTEDEISDDYVVRYIPRFILIGPDGNIINNNAPRPSDEATSALFDSFDDL